MSFLLLGLLFGCAPAPPTTPPTVTITTIPSAIPTETRLPTPEPTPTTQVGIGSNLQRIAQLGGRIKGITVVGEQAYVGMGPRLVTIDISQPERPRLVRQSGPLPGLVTQLVQISEGPAPLLLVNAGKYLVVMDTSDPDELKSIHQRELEGELSALVWDERESIAYAGGTIFQGPNSLDNAGFIATVRITPDNHLRLMSSIAVPQGRILSLALGQGSLFAGVEGPETGLAHLEVTNLGELSTPKLVIASPPEDPLHPMSLQVIGNTLYLGYRFMEAYDITDPNHPVQTWRMPPGEVDVIDDFILAGERIYLFGWTILNEYARNFITPPQPITGAPMGETAAVTALHNRNFLVAYNDLEIYDASDPQSLQLLGSYLPSVTNAIAAVANQKAVFVLDNGIGDGHTNAVLWALSLPDLKPLGQMITENPNNWPGVREGSQWITLEGDRLYLASIDSLWAYDVTRIQPSLSGKIEIVDGRVDAITALNLGGKRLLAIAQEMADQFNVVTLYDLTDLQRPIELGNPLTLEQGNTKQMAWNGLALYVLLDTSYHADQDSLYALNLDNNALALRESLDLAKYVENMAANKNLIGLLGVDEKMTRSLLSSVQPEPIKLLSQTTLPAIGRGIAITEEKALVVVGSANGSQLLSYAVQDATNPRQEYVMDISSSDTYQVSILVIPPYVVLANGAGGVEVFK